MASSKLAPGHDQEDQLDVLDTSIARLVDAQQTFTSEDGRHAVQSRLEQPRRDRQILTDQRMAESMTRAMLDDAEVLAQSM